MFFFSYLPEGSILPPAAGEYTPSATCKVTRHVTKTPRACNIPS